MEDNCKNCGDLREQHDHYAQAIGAKEIYVWSLGVPLPVSRCTKFEPSEEEKSR